MNAEAEGQVFTQIVAVNIEFIGAIEEALVAVARHIPHHHLVALANGLAAQFRIAQRAAAHMRQRRLPANGLLDHIRDQARLGAQRGQLLGMLIEAQHAGAHGAAGGVVAADNQQQQIAQILHRVHVPGRFAVHEAGDEIRGRGLFSPLVPQVHKIFEAAEHLLLPFLVGGHHALGAGQRGGHVRPPGQLAPLCEGEVEQGGEHACGQLDGDLLDPVEGLADGQAVQHVDGALADDRGKLAQGLGAHGGADGAALDVVLGPVHGDKHGQLKVVQLVADGNRGLG